ncbi:hypothetical protein [Flavobacterium branchiicola]|uniref:Lipoprotein n=1 Tax=Flavobacterium branchiicola TaxID=1114875 RepID=A0ABV9PGR4_9FLAO|nr:hypothetical protein [Flavobacterium branchiicola]MBS7255915.1 hypothetical protein [Flavobacterium branchiicola]
MKANFIYKIFRILLLPLLFLSCSSNLDFDQVKDLKLEPVLVANLAYFDVDAKELVNDGGNQIAFDIRDFDIFKDKFFNEHLKKAAFDVQIDNTIERAFAVNLLLINAKDEIVETLSYRVPAYKGTPNTTKYPTEVFENQRLDLLKQTVKIAFVVLITAGPPLTEQSLGKLNLKSSATVYMEIE